MKTTSSDKIRRKSIRRPAKSSGTRSAQEFQLLEAVSDADGRDLAALAALLDPEAKFDVATLETAIQNEGTAIFVKRIRGKIVASATVVRFFTPTGTHHRIEDVIVHPRLQGKGIGRKIMLYILDHLRSVHANSVELTSRPSRIAANALYRALGFSLRKTNVYSFRLG